MRDKGKFQFSDAATQRAEARLNAKEATALLSRWLPAPVVAAAPPSEPVRPTSPGSCFRKVIAILGERRK